MSFYNLLSVSKIIFPYLFTRDRSNAGLLFGLFAGITHGAFWAIAGVLILVSVKLFEPLSLLVFYILVLLMAKWIEGCKPLQSIQDFLHSLIIFIMDLVEESIFKEGAKRSYNFFINIIKKILDIFVDAFKKPFSGILPFAFGIFLVYDRYLPAIAQSTVFGDKDAMLRAIKLIGNNVMPSVNTSTLVYQAFWVALAKALSIKAYDFFFYVQPVFPILFLLGVYFFVKTVFGSSITAFLTLILSAFYYKEMPFQQLFFMVFLLPSLTFFRLYLSEKSNYLLLLYFEGLALVGIGNWYLGVFAIVTTLLIFSVFKLKGKPTIQ